jgi:RNA polymerase sigma-70 factor (ECF subfamily)
LTGFSAPPRTGSHPRARRCHTVDVITDPSDEQLVHRTLAGETGAFATLVRRHRRAAIARAIAVLGDPAEAEDAAQDAFVQGYEHLAMLREPARFGPWLLRIVHRRALNLARTIRRRRSEPLGEEQVAGNPSPDETLHHEDLRRQILAAMAALTPVQREVLLLADVEHWSHAEIAGATGISVLMSRRHLSEARRRLRELLATAMSE